MKYIFVFRINWEEPWMEKEHINIEKQKRYVKMSTLEIASQKKIGRWIYNVVKNREN